MATFESFCAHQDPATLAADQDYIKQYEGIVKLYAEFASKDVSKVKSPGNWPQAIRYRKAGLRALKSVASSDSLSSETNRQLSVIIPAILLNIYSEDGHLLERLEQRDEEREELEKGLALKRRQSISTVRTTETAEGDRVAASGTTEDADKLAEEEVEIIALQALRHIFSAINRAQLRLATSTVLNFVTSRSHPNATNATTIDEARWPHSASWATTLFTMICVWAPVQDRYVVLVTAVESLGQSSPEEADLEKQLALVEIVHSLLSSGVSLIGLSVMDVMIRLIQQILTLLQLTTPATNLGRDIHLPVETSGPNEPFPKEKRPQAANSIPTKVVSNPSSTRQRILARLQKSISSLATHVYYSEQISDMLRAILLRLKPPPRSGVATVAAAIEDPEKAADAVASSASLQEKTDVSKFFSFDTARLFALSCVKDILIMANSKSKRDTQSANRARVSSSVWEGTQWLLRDVSLDVRMAYVDALVTWLQLETQKSDLRIPKERAGSRRERKDKNGSLVRRAVSSASRRDKSPSPVRSSFLQLLHLAIYDNIHQYSDSEEDLMLVHLLLVTLMNKLGVNSLRSGLPMMMRVQEDIQIVDDPVTKIRFGSLVHGYLWALETHFDFDASKVGRSITAEITRRKKKGMWSKTIQVPPVPISQIPTAAAAAALSPLSLDAVAHEALRPCDGREAIVERIAMGHSISLQSPPTSPPASPGSRSFSVPMLATTQAANHDSIEELPPHLVEQLMSDWTRESCLASTAKDTGSSASVSGSRTGTGHVSAARNLLSVNIPAGSISDIDVPLHRNSHRDHAISINFGLVGGPHSILQSSRRNSASHSPINSSSVRSALRVEDLKRALSGSKHIAFPTSERRGAENEDIDDSASESMMSSSELSFMTAEPETGTQSEKEGSSTPRAFVAHAYSNEDEREEHENNTIPPVPPLPESVRGSAVVSPMLRSPSVKTPTTTSSQGTRSDMQRPSTAPSRDSANANGGPTSPMNVSFGNLRKPRSVKKGSSVRGQSREGGSRVVSLANSTAGSLVLKPDFSGLLRRIEVSEDDMDGIPVPKDVRETKPPY